MQTLQSKQFREQMRIIQRKLSVLKNSSDCFDGKKLHLRQCHALVEIGRSKQLSLKELAYKLDSDVSIASRTVEGLVKEEYLSRTPSLEDRRSVEISLTPKGEKVFATVEEQMEDLFAQIFSYIPEKDKKEVLNSLDLIIGALNKNASDKSL